MTQAQKNIVAKNQFVRLMRLVRKALLSYEATFCGDDPQTLAKFRPARLARYNALLEFAAEMTRLSADKLNLLVSYMWEESGSQVTICESYLTWVNTNN